MRAHIDRYTEPKDKSVKEGSNEVFMHVTLTHCFFIDR